MKGCVPSIGSTTQMPGASISPRPVSSPKKEFLREGFLEPIPDQHLGVQVGLARHVLHPLALDGQGAQAVEVAEGEFPGFVDQSRGEFEAPLEGVGFHLCDPRFAHLTETSVHASFQSQAAPRTPLESPWTALRIGVSNTGEKV